MAQMAGLGALPFAMSGGGFAPAPQRRPMAGLGMIEDEPQMAAAPLPEPMPAPAPMMTMADRSNVIYTLAQQGYTPTEIQAQLAAMGISDPVGAATPEPEAEPVEAAGVMDLLRTGTLQQAEMFGIGAGTLQQAAGAEDAGQAVKDAASAAFELSPEDQQALAMRAEGKGIIGQAADAAIQSSPQLAATLAAGAVGGKTGAALGSLIAPGPGTAIGGLLGSVVGGTLVNIPLLIGSASERAAAEGKDVNDPAVRDDILAVGGANAVAESLINLIPGGKQASVGLRTAAQLAAQQATRKAVGRVGAVGAKAAVLEASTEAFQTLTEIVAFDDELRAQFDEGEIKAMLPVIQERYGEEITVAMLAGGMMGGGAGTAIGAVGERQYQGAIAKEQADRTEATLALKTAAERGGLTPEVLESAANDPRTSATVKSGAQALRAAQAEVANAKSMLDGAVGAGDPEMIQYANKRLADALAQAEVAYDSVIPAIGGLNIQQVKAQDAQKAADARKLLADDGVADITNLSALPDGEVRGLERDYVTAKQKVEAAQQVLNGPDMFETAKRQAAQQALQKAQADLDKTRNRIAIKTGMETEQSIRQKAQAKLKAEQRDAATQKQFDRVFKPFLDSGDVAGAQAKAQEIVTAMTAKPDKGLENQIARMETALMKAQTPAEIDAIESKIAELKSRRGQEAPIVAAANRILQTAAPQQAGAGVQGSSPAPAGQSAAPNATTGTATPAAQTVTPASVSPATQGQPAAAGATPTGAPAPAAAPMPQTSAAPMPPPATPAPATQPAAPSGPTGTPVEQMRQYAQTKIVAPPEIAIAAGPEILARGTSARTTNMRDPDMTPTEAWSQAAISLEQLRMERDLAAALGLPVDATPSQMAAALTAAQQAAPAAQPSPEPQPEVVQPGAAPEPKPDTDLAYPANLMERDTLKTPNGTPVEVQYAVVSLDSMVPSNFDDGRINPAYPAVLQPRDRTTPDTQEQLQSIIATFDPRQLGKTPTTNNGAPIIDTQGNVESGNGRAMMFERIHRENPDLVAQYEQFLKDSGFNTDGISKPILVRIRRQPMTAEQLQTYIAESNSRDTMSMATREQAMVDAKAMTPATLSLYRGGEIDAAGNASFVNSFIDTVVPTNERKDMRTSDGRISQDGVRRIRNAMFAKAYGDSDPLGTVAESTDSNIKTISGAMMDIAPSWAQMRQDAADGKIDPAADKTDALIEAVRLVDRARREGKPLPMMVNQTDLLAGETISPEGRGFLDLMFRNTADYTKPTGREKLTGALREYARLAGQTSPDPDLLGQKTQPSEMLAATRNWLEAQYATEPQSDMFATTPAPVPEPTPNPTPEQLQAQAQAEADAAAAQAKIDAKNLKPKPYDPKAVEPDKRKGDIDYTDLMDVFGRNSTDLRAANAFVLAQAKKNGFENYVAWDADTGEVLGAGTSNSPNSTGFSEAVYGAMDAGRNVSITHNHPSTGSISPGDVGFLVGRRGTNVTLHAVADNGNRFTMRMTQEGVDRLRNVGSKQLRADLYTMMSSAQLAAQKALIKAGLAAGNPNTGTMTSWDEKEATELDVRRAVNQALASVNLVEYTERVTTPKTERQKVAIQKARTDARKAIKKAYPLSASKQSGVTEAGLGEVQQLSDVRPERPRTGRDQAVDSGGTELGGTGRAASDGLDGRPDLDVPTDDFILAERQSNRTIQDAVDTFRQLMPLTQQKLEIPDWLDVDPNGQSALQSAIDAAKNPKSTTLRVLEFMETQLVNSLAPIRNLELKVKGKLGIGMDSAFKAAEVAVNDSGRNEMLMLYGAAKLGPNGQMRPAPGTIGLMTMLRKLHDPGMTQDQKGQRVIDWQNYMGARRAEEYKAKGLKPPLTDQQIAEGLALQNPVFDEVAADWKRFNDANVDFLVDTGRISTALAAKLKSDAAYVPFYRSDERMDGAPDLYDQAGIEKASNDLIRSGGSLLARNPGIKKLKGGDTYKVNSLIENMVRNSQAMIAAGMRNSAANKVFDILEGTGYAKIVPGRQQNAKGDWIRVEKPENAIRVWKKGHESFIVPETADAMPVMLALASMEPVRLGGIARFMAQVGSFFRQAITLNPGFMVRNFIRDTVSVAVLTGGKNLRINPLQGLALGYDVAGKRSPTRQNFTTVSGMGDYRFGGTDIGMGDSDMLIELGIGKKGLGFRFREMIGGMERVGTAFELANRMTYYETLLKQGVRDDEAAYQALTLVNYNRRGASAMLRGLLPMVPFLNARIQGLARLGEDVIVNKGQRMQALGKLALNGSILMAFSAALWAYNNEDEERREKFEAEPLHRRLNYHIVYLPNGKTVLIPKAFEIGTMFGTSIEMAMEAAVQGDTDELGAAGLMTLFNTFAFNPIPQAMVPALEVMFNYNMFTGQPIEGRRMEDRTVTSRITPQTSALAIALSQNGLGRMTGLSPIAVDHLLQGYGGLAYSLPATVIDVAAGSMGLLPARPEGVLDSIIPEATPGPIRGAVAGVLKETFGSMLKDPADDSANRWVEEFYSRRNAITQIYRTASEAAKFGDVERAKELLASAPATPAAYKLVNRAGARLSELNEAARFIRQDSTMTAAEKRQKLQPIIKERNRISARVMEIVRELEEKQGTSFRRAAV